MQKFRHPKSKKVHASIFSISKYMHCGVHLPYPHNEIAVTPDIPITCKTCIKISGSKDDSR